MEVLQFLNAYIVTYKLKGATLQPGKTILMPIPDIQTSKKTSDSRVPASLDLNLCSFHVSRIGLRYGTLYQTHVSYTTK